MNDLQAIPLLTAPPSEEDFWQLRSDQVPSEVLRLIQAIAQDADVLRMDSYLVGGFVRDLLLGRPSLDLDFVIEDGLASNLASLVEIHIGGHSTIHLPFLTATWIPDKAMRESFNLPLVDGQPLTIDLVTARRETYAYPGALPTVEPGTLSDDLFRRDFTINAMAIQLIDYQWVDLHGGFKDLQAGLLRVLHDRSFEDDPTRITRGVRFACRFGFQFAPETEQLINPELSAITAVSGERWRAELIRIFAEIDPLACLLKLDDVGLLNQILPGISIRQNGSLVVALRALHRMLVDYQYGAVFESVAFVDAIWPLLTYISIERAALIERLKLQPSVMIGAKAIERGLTLLADQPDSKPSAFVHAIEPIELPACAALWAIVLPGQRPIVERYVQKWRTMQPITTGDDLKARGLQPGPAFGMLLRQLRDGWIDGLITSKADEDRLLDRLIADLKA